MVKHAIASGEYNSRRRECDDAVARLKNVIPHTRATRRKPQTLQDHARLLPEVSLPSRAACCDGKLVRTGARKSLEKATWSVGALMRKSHTSLRAIMK